MMEVRSAARLVLFDESRRVLLLRHNDGHGREFWATPGGGLEPGETVEQAARREAAEELGATNVELTLLWTGNTQFRFGDRTISQTETFFLVTEHARLLGPEVEEAHRVEGILEARWWTLEDIESSGEMIFPTDLVNRVRDHVRVGRRAARDPHRG